ncbi:sigma-70 family RNA polymerase sigma factor [Rugosimonospora acidiphila]|uniref:RNA polymerase sigma factor n=2 Tax=Rugosimonospora acidiphila TaxID=556531 RepID=A0ABP9SNM9_9ACTN
MRQLYENSVADLFRYLVRVTLGRRQLAEDLLQETYLRAWRKLDQLPTEPAQALPWLFTVARRVAIDAARAREARPAEVGAFNLVAVPSTDNHAERVVDVQTVRAALARLTPQHREVLFEVYFRDASIQDVARRLGIPLGTAQSRTFYALRSLRALLSEGQREGAERQGRVAPPGKREPSVRARQAVGGW